MKFSERAKYFSTNYDLLIDYHVGNGYNKYIGEKNKPCRFCNKAKPEVTFKDVAHAVPEFLGNKQLILLNECDQCNKFVSNNLEVHLDKFTRRYRSSSLIKGKTGIPVYKSKNKDVRFVIKKDEPGYLICPTENQDVTFDKKNKVVTVKFDIEPYIPVGVYKCLVKIGLSVLNNEYFDDFKYTTKWVMNKNHDIPFLKPLKLIESFVPGPRPFNETNVKILKKKWLVSTLPTYILIFSFGNISYQLIMPSDLDVNLGASPYKIVYYPLRFDLQWKHGEVERIEYDLTSSDVVKGEKKEVVYSYSELVELPELAGKSFEELGIKYR
ncbi:HNH endonuclease [Vibrio fluvialis]|uniref:HNH endonuclease n=1 Tax=Vibrio fluvialis TaxID=676 RepID=UPI00192BCFC5|nr:HNH endonuclease [Vibrio fluvialis]MBL4306287.1 hypothetical protein [Vibrio fluvialis]